MDSTSQQHAAIHDDIAHTLAMNPALSTDDLNIVLQQRMAAQNHRPLADFCGLSSAQMSNWLYAPLNALADVAICTPLDLSHSPVMRYLDLMLNEAMQNEGSFKATAKGNLPASVVAKASQLLPEFALSKYPTAISISEYAGSNEDKFNALHYTRVLAEMAGIIYRRAGRFHVKNAAQQQYLAHGIGAFFMPMLEAAVYRYNWGYFDGWEQEAELRTFWLFMLWRLQHHGCIKQLVDEMVTAFPTLLSQLSPVSYLTPTRLLGVLIESRFVERFLGFWGFVVADPKRYFAMENEPRLVDVQVLMRETFRFQR